MKFKNVDFNKWTVLNGALVPRNLYTKARIAYWSIAGLLAFDILVGLWQIL